MKALFSLMRRSSLVCLNVNLRVFSEALVFSQFISGPLISISGGQLSRSLLFLHRLRCMESQPSSSKVHYRLSESPEPQDTRPNPSQPTPPRRNEPSDTERQLTCVCVQSISRVSSGVEIPSSSSGTLSESIRPASSPLGGLTEYPANPSLEVTFRHWNHGYRPSRRSSNRV
jgi:hypothetical protein